MLPSTDCEILAEIGRQNHRNERNDVHAWMAPGKDFPRQGSIYGLWIFHDFPLPILKELDGLMIVAGPCGLYIDTMKGSVEALWTLDTIV